MSFFGNRRQAEQPPVPSTPVEKTQLPKPSVSQTPVGFETVLGANSVMEGVLRSNANVRLDGIFTGTLEISGNVLVGETAKITADINAKNISIAGAVRGNVSGKKVQLLRTGRIWGDIHATALTTEEGAFIDGKITMVSNESAQPTPEPEFATDDSSEIKLPSFLANEPGINEFDDEASDTGTTTPEAEAAQIVEDSLDSGEPNDAHSSSNDENKDIPS